jgi:hypothetical protein
MESFLEESAQLTRRIASMKRNGLLMFKDAKISDSVITEYYPDGIIF